MRFKEFLLQEIKEYHRSFQFGSIVLHDGKIKALEVQDPSERNLFLIDLKYKNKKPAISFDELLDLLGKELRVSDKTKEAIKKIIDSEEGVEALQGKKFDQSGLISESQKIINDYDDWIEAVKKAFPDKASRIKFKGTVVKGKTTVHAEIPGEDRSYGEFDYDKEEGWVSPD